VLSEAENATGLGFSTDDAWIDLRFARNLAQGHGFCYNQGESMFGSVSPLWTLMLSLIHVLLKEPMATILAIKFIGTVLFGLAVCLVHLIIMQITRNRTTAVLTSIAMVTTNFLNWGAISGLEIPSAVFLTLLFIYFYYRPDNIKHRYLGRIGMIAALSLTIYAQPQCILLLLFFVIDQWILNRPRKMFRLILFDIFCLAACLTPYFVFNTSVSHSLFPLISRTWVHEQKLMNAPHYFIGGIIHAFRINPLLVIGILSGLTFFIYFRFIRKRKEEGLMNGHDPTKKMILPLITLFYPMLTGVIMPYMNASYQGGRFIAGYSAVVVIVGCIGFQWLYNILKRRLKRYVVISISILFIIIYVYNTYKAQRSMCYFAADNVYCINSMQVKMGKWLNANTGEREVIAAHDIGGIGYWSERRMIDLKGVITCDLNLPTQPSDSMILTGLKYAIDKKAGHLALYPDWIVDVLDYEEEEMEQLHNDYIMNINSAIMLLKNSSSQWDIPLEMETYCGIIVKRYMYKNKESFMMVFSKRQ
jgi:hypothetical protein